MTLFANVRRRGDLVDMVRRATGFLLGFHVQLSVFCSYNGCRPTGPTTCSTNLRIRTSVVGCAALLCSTPIIKLIKHQGWSVCVFSFGQRKKSFPFKLPAPFSGTSGMSLNNGTRFSVAYLTTPVLIRKKKWSAIRF